MTDPIDDYRTVLRDQLTGVPGADEVVDELYDHLRESTETLTRRGLDRAEAGERAVERLGDVRLVARSIRADRGWLRGSDPVSVPRRPFLLCEALLILAAVAYAVAIRAYDQPCDGVFKNFIEPPQECVDRWEWGDMLPFLPALPWGLDGLSTAPAIHAGLLAGLGLMAASTVLLALLQPWSRGTRRWALASGALTLTTALAVANHGFTPTHFPGWGIAATIGIQIAALAAVVLLWTDPLPNRRATPGPPRQAVMSYTRYRVRASLVLLAAAGGGIQLFPLLLGPFTSVLIGVGREHGDLLQLATPWFPQLLHPLLIATPALISLALAASRNGKRATGSESR